MLSLNEANCLPTGPSTQYHISLRCIHANIFLFFSPCEVHWNSTWRRSKVRLWSINCCYAPKSSLQIDCFATDADVRCLFPWGSICFSSFIFSSCDNVLHNDIILEQFIMLNQQYLKARHLAKHYSSCMRKKASDVISHLKICRYFFYTVYCNLKVNTLLYCYKLLQGNLSWTCKNVQFLV